MNVTDYTYLLNKPNAVNERQTAALEKIVNEFPFFQSARALRLKGLYNENSFKYNYALKVAAAHTTDRSVLFEFITSDTFSTIHKESFHHQQEELHNIEVATSETIQEPKEEPKTNTLEQSILISIKEAAVSPEIEKENSAPEILTEKLAIGKPLDFSKEEQHSFQEWLQLSKARPIERTKAEEEENFSDTDIDKKKKIALIDRFIEASPKIPPVRPNTVPPTIFEHSDADHSYLMTETLARVYLEQKKYQKAIQAYQILILKYPEKSSFFADRILDIKNLQQNNNK